MCFKQPIIGKSKRKPLKKYKTENSANKYLFQKYKWEIMGSDLNLYSWNKTMK